MTTTTVHNSLRTVLATVLLAIVAPITGALTHEETLQRTLASSADLTTTISVSPPELELILLEDQGILWIAQPPCTFCPATQDCHLGDEGQNCNPVIPCCCLYCNGRISCIDPFPAPLCSL